MCIRDSNLSPLSPASASHQLRFATYRHAHVHYITLHYITLHYTTLHYTTLHYITLHYITCYSLPWKLQSSHVLRTSWGQRPWQIDISLSELGGPLLWMDASPAKKGQEPLNPKIFTNHIVRHLSWRRLLATCPKPWLIIDLLLTKTRTTTNACIRSLWLRQPLKQSVDRGICTPWLGACGGMRKRAFRIVIELHAWGQEGLVMGPSRAVMCLKIFPWQGDCRGRLYAW